MDNLGATQNLMDDATSGLEFVKDLTMLTRVIQTFSKYESWRQMNFDARWTAFEQLYNGVVPLKFWEGTEVPRASMSVRLIHSQVHSVMPLLYQALFGNDAEWFQVQAIGETAPQAASDIQARLLYLCEHPADQLGDSARNQITASLLDFLIKGIAIGAVQLNPMSMEPVISRVNPLDFYIDPGCSLNIENAKSVIWRKVFTVDEIDGMRNTPGFKVPGREELMNTAKSTPIPSADSFKQNMELSRGVVYNPASDSNGVFGADQNLEVLIYYTKSQVSWVLNRKHVLFNGTNIYGFIPFVAASCFQDPDHIYGKGFAEILSDSQRYLQALQNARLDEISLAIQPPRAVKADQHDNRMTISQKYFRPGAVQLFKDPKNDIVLQQPQNVTSSTWQEQSNIFQQAQEYTGVNSMIMQGQPISSNASTSAASITAQREMPSMRILMMVLSLENYFLVPMLYKMLAMHRIHSQPSQLLPGIAEGEQIQVSAESLRSDVQFRILGSTRMVSRDRLMQILPFLTQYLLNPELMGLLQKSGMTVDITEWVRMLQDATGTKYTYQLVRPLSPEEQQQLMQPTPDQVQDQQKTQAANTIKMELADKKMQAEQLRAKTEENKEQTKAEASITGQILKSLLEKAKSNAA